MACTRLICCTISLVTIEHLSGLEGEGGGGGGGAQWFKTIGDDIFEPLKNIYISFLHYTDMI